MLEIFYPNLKGNNQSALSSSRYQNLQRAEFLQTAYHLHKEKRFTNIDESLDAFPYVNGGLFRTPMPLPNFTFKSRKAIIDSGGENWAAINPDIFGSMIQAVVSPDKRGSLGMHYTSVPNIMKVIEPLFLNELNEEFEKE